MFKQTRKPPGEPVIFPEISELPITETNLCANQEKQRRFHVSKTKIKMKVRFFKNNYKFKILDLNLSLGTTHFQKI